MMMIVMMLQMLRVNTTMTRITKTSKTKTTRTRPENLVTPDLNCNPPMSISIFINFHQFPRISKQIQVFVITADT